MINKTPSSSSSWLFGKTANGFLTKMDDSTSMVSLALRDWAESSGRTVMEYKRDKHGGRERLIEESATSIIWAFGINWMKQAYDWVAKDVLKAIDLPDLDASLLKKAEAPKKGLLPFFFSSPSAQSLMDSSGKVDKGVEKFLTKTAHNAAENQAYKDLLNKAVKTTRKYAFSNTLKFLLATGIPVSAIAFGIPSFNQWLTRKKLAQEKALKEQALNEKIQKENAPKEFVPNPGAAFAPQQVPSFPTPVVPGIPMSSPSNAFRGAIYSGQPTSARYAATPFTAYNAPAQVQNPFSASLSASSFTSTGMSHGPVHFGGGVGDMASAFLQNERMNTLLVDGVISGGRIFKARNGEERGEIVFREASIIGFLYFGQRIFQSLATSLLKGGSELSFDATRFMNQAYQGKEKEFLKHFSEAKAVLGSDFAKKMEAIQAQEGGQFWRNIWTPKGHAKIQAGREAFYHLEKDLMGKIREYFTHDPAELVKAGKQNLIFETAKECGWIPTFEGAATPDKSLGQVLGDGLKGLGKGIQKLPHNSFSLLKNPQPQTVQGVERYLSSGAAPYLNVTKKVDTQAILNFVHHMEKIEDALQKDASAGLSQLMKKAIKGRSLAWLGSNAICTLFLSVLCPLMQHYITYRKTGKNYFPGIQPS